MNSVLHRSLAAATAILLGLGTAVAVAAPASAQTADISNDGIYWSEVSDDALEIVDAEGHYANLLGSGQEVWGWTNDAFDGFLDELVVTDGVDDYSFTMTPQTFDINSGGVSTIVSTGYIDLGDGVEVDVTVTLTIQGSYARWTFESTATAALGLWVRGNLGSDGATVYQTVSSSAMVSSDDTSENDPIIGYQIAGTGAAFTVADGNDDVRLDFPASGTTTLIVALQDYDPCGRDAAFAAMVARVPTLSSTFGQVIPLLDTTCLTIAAPVAFPASESTNQTLSVTDVSVSPDSGPGTLLDWWYGRQFFGDDITFISQGLPSGLTLSFDPATMSLHLTGTAAPGTYPVRVAFFQKYSDSPGDADFPLLATLSIQITGKQLAATGASEATPMMAALAGLLLLVGGAGLGARRMLARRR